MKRLTALLLILILVASAFCFNSCNVNVNFDDVNVNNNQNSEAPTQAPTQKPTEAPTQAPTQKPTEKPQLSEEELFEEMLITLIGEYGGKRLSVFGDSISTFGGISNNTEYNSTIGGNAVFYNGSNYGLTSSNNTYWGRFCERIGARLCVNNSWSGDSMRSGRFQTRAANLHKDTGAKRVDPDLIFVYFGINDLWGKDNTKAQPNGNLNELVANKGDRTAKEVTQEWLEDVLTRYEAGTLSIGSANWDELYALVMHTITTNYPNAKIVNVGLTVNTNANYSACTELVPEHNEAITILSDYYGTVYVDQMAVINSTNLSKYMGDGAGSYLHPNNAGHGKLFEEIVKALYYDLVEE